MNIQLQNKNTGVVEQAPTGFSWTTLFFMGLVPIIRGDFGNFLKYTGLFIITFSLYHPFFAATYNKMYIKKLVMEGFVPANEQAETYLKLNGLYINPQQLQTVVNNG